MSRPTRSPSQKKSPIKQNKEFFDDADFKALDRFLSSDAMPEDGMLLDILDGYLTALAISPDLPPVEQWLPLVWSESGQMLPEFRNKREAENTLAMILRLMDTQLALLEQQPEHYHPIFDSAEYPDAQGQLTEWVDPVGWAMGFYKAVSLYRDTWQPLFDDAEAKQRFEPIRLLGEPENTEADKALIATPAQRETLAEQLPDIVRQLYQFWLQREQATTPDETPLSPASMAAAMTADLAEPAPKTGRNDPCPCGSGKKYKKCCGK